MPTDIKKEPHDFAALILYRFFEGVIQFLVLEYHKPHRFKANTMCHQIKFPGGDAKPKESPDEFVRREFKEETDLEVHFCDEVYRSPNKAGPDEPPHYQIFFATDQAAGELRKLQKDDDDDPDEKLGPPFWIGSDEAQKRLFHSHRTAWQASIKRIAIIDKQFATAAAADPILHHYL